MKYSIYKLPDDDGKTPKTPIAQMLEDLDNDEDLSLKEKYDNLMAIAISLNISRSDLLRDFKYA